MLRYTDAAGNRHELRCDVIAGCDGFHGVCRPAIPASLLQVAERGYPYAWLGILATVPPSTDELIYARHQAGFALHTMRTPQVSRLYLQVPADEDLACWPDDRIWAELRTRLGVPGWELCDGPITEKAIAPMRSFVASPMRYRRLFLAGDAAHIVPPTGAKGLNLALADVTLLARALTSLLHDQDPAPAAAYSDTSLARVWRATHFSWWMTSMLHVDPAGRPVRRPAAARPAPLPHLLPRRRHLPGRELHRLLPPPLALAPTAPPAAPPSHPQALAPAALSALPAAPGCPPRWIPHSLDPYSPAKTTPTPMNPLAPRPPVPNQVGSARAPHGALA